MIWSLFAIPVVLFAACEEEKGGPKAEEKRDPKEPDTGPPITEPPTESRRAEPSPADPPPPETPNEEEPQPCHPDRYSLQCREGFFFYCPDRGRVTRLPFDQIPENEFCIEGLIRKCTENGWQVQVEEDIQNKEKLQDCLGEEGGPENEEVDAGGMEDVPKIEEIEEEGEGEGDAGPPERPPCEAGSYQCRGDILDTCTEEGWEPIENCRGGECRAEEGACYFLEGREVCDPMQEIVFHRGNFGNGPGLWRTINTNFTCDPICDAPESGFPVHSNDQRQATSTAQFAVDPRTTRLFLSVSGEGNPVLLEVRVDSLNSIRIRYPGHCRDNEFLLEGEALIRLNQSITADGMVDVILWAGGGCNYNWDWHIGGLEEPCEREPMINRCSVFIPYRVMLTPCRTETTWVRRG